MPLQFERTRLLILCKTYPSPSSGYVETSCVAAMKEDGTLIRLYPVPFRLLEETTQFHKWQWIDADIARSPNDRRPESYRLRADTLQCVGPAVSTRADWADRRHWLDKLPAHRSMAHLDQSRVESGTSLGLLTGQSIDALDITPVRDTSWTPDERAKLSQAQADLFSAQDQKSLVTLRKLPFDFHYRYHPPGTANTVASNRHKIVDWEAGALYWKLQQTDPVGWEAPFRQKFEQNYPPGTSCS